MKSDLNFEDMLDRDLCKFQPFYFGWKTVVIDSHYGVSYQNPLDPNSFVTISEDEENVDEYTVSFEYKSEYKADPPIVHRLLGPARYQVVNGKLEDIEWYLFDIEYSEYDYWFLVCQLFAKEIRMSLSMDECRYWVDKKYGAPFPSRLNLAIENLDDTEDEERVELNAHPVWEINGQVVTTSMFWKDREEKGYQKRFFKLL